MVQYLDIFGTDTRGFIWGRTSRAT